MVKKLIVFLFVVGMGIGFFVGATGKTCFTNMPDSLSPLLTAVNRADFIDFLESEMKAEVTNRFGGKSEMTELTPDYIRVQVTPQSTWQMKLLSVNDSTVLSVLFLQFVLRLVTVISSSILPVGKSCPLHPIWHHYLIWMILFCLLPIR